MGLNLEPLIIFDQKEARYQNDLFYESGNFLYYLYVLQFCPWLAYLRTQFSAINAYKTLENKIFISEQAFSSDY